MDQLPSRRPSLVDTEVGADKRVRRRAKPTDARIQRLIDHTIEHGYVLIPDAFTNADVQEAKAEVARVSASPDAGPAVERGRNTFEGLRTQRIYNLVNKSRVFDKFALHPDILALNDYFLSPGYLLNTYQSINIHPGEDPQTLHHDDGTITVPRPHHPFGSVSCVTKIKA